jgi:chaperonin cofactor prefoldin
MTAYMVRLETRVATLEVRGSPHLSDINNRLTVLEAATRDNKQRLDKVTDIMTRKLNINP